MKTENLYKIGVVKRLKTSSSTGFVRYFIYDIHLDVSFLTQLYSVD